jgi:hypothetical protein
MSTLLAVATALLLAGGQQVDPELVGSWSSGGQPFMELRGDGTGQSIEGPVRWSAAGGLLTMTGQDGADDRVAYQVSGETLALALPSGVVRMVRTPGAGKRPSQSGPTAAPAPSTASGSRAVRFNGRALAAAERSTLERLERQIGRIPDGDYWYDPKTGASGRWGGPTLAFLPAGLELGGAAPANASGGGSGALTGVFINGREAHPADVAGLRGLVGAVLPGRWWVDAAGNYGREGGPHMGNLVALAQARQRDGQGGGTAWSKRYEGASPRDTMNLASDGNTTCVSVSGYSRCTGE